MASFSKCVLFFALAQGAEGVASALPPRRIESHYQDLSQVQRIYLSAGLISLVEFPKPITEVRVGNPNSLKALISTVSSRELTLYLSSNSSKPTNLIVRAENKVYFFDIIPSRSTHQDYVKVSGSYGGPLRGGFARTIFQATLGPEPTKLPAKREPTKTLKVSL